jgi:hypothetical protein
VGANARTGINEYHSEGVAPFSLDVFYKVQTDLEYRKQWDSSCAGLTEIEAPTPKSSLM